MFSKRIKELRKTKKMTQRQLADLLFVDCSTVTKWETGKANPDFDKQQKLAEIFNVSMDYLLGRNSDYPSSNTMRIPVLGYVAAGIPIEAIEDIIDYEEIEAGQLNSNYEYFGLKIKGDSMSPRIQNGDVVIVRKQPDVDTGDVAIVCVNGDNATCKQIKKHAEGISLIPFNTAHEIKFYSNNEIESLPISIIGKVVELRGKF
ncbi:MAG: helix-turn-helix domain-containing protein [Clostridia bacterium]|nr:helix-turn-helix domain-containing protein [Clostridia bacterium]